MYQTAKESFCLFLCLVFEYNINKKAFQWDAYRPLVNRMFFSDHLMPELMGRGWGPRVNKFKQVSSDGHQMSLAGGAGFPCLMSRGGGRAEGSIQ